LGRKLFIDAQAFNIVPSTEKCSALKSPFTSGRPRSEDRNACAIACVSRRSRFFEKASNAFSSIISPTNQRNSMSNSSRSTSRRSERIEWRSCRSEARKKALRRNRGAPDPLVKRRKPRVKFSQRRIARNGWFAGMRASTST